MPWATLEALPVKVYRSDRTVAVWRSVRMEFHESVQELVEIPPALRASNVGAEHGPMIDERG
jgi:hypothetical protein